MIARAGAAVVGVAFAAGCSSPPDVPFGVRATETVWCADADGVVDTVTWQGHDGPLTGLDVRVVSLEAGAVSEADLLDACARRFGWAASQTLCEAYAAPDAVHRYAATEFVSERHGEAGADRPGFPVVLRGRVTCEELRLDAGIADQLRDWQSTERFNQWRSREELLRAVSDDGCLDIATARQQAMRARAALAGDWPVLETARDPEDPSHAGLCLDVRLHREGFIEVGYHGFQPSPGGRAGPADDVRDVSEPDRPADP